MDPFPKPEPSDSFVDLAERINEGFHAADDQLVRVGLLLIEARARVEASGQKWTKWVAANLEKSLRQVQRCMKLARADDPAAAAEAERAKTRTAVAAHRARDDATYVSRQPDSPVDLSGIKARIGKESIDLSEFSPATQAQIARELGFGEDAEDNEEDEADEPSNFNLLGNMGGAGRNVRHTHTERYTPVRVFVDLGNPRFNLDPASPGAERSQVPADRHITIYENGLTVDWGNAFVWLNPPSGKRNDMHEFIRKFMRHANGIMLVPCYTNNKWWRDVIAAADAVLFMKRIDFINGRPGEGSESFGVIGVCLVAMGERAVEILRTGERNGLGVIPGCRQPSTLMPLHPWRFEAVINGSRERCGFSRSAPAFDIQHSSEPAREDRPIVVPMMPRRPPAEPVARSGKHCTLSVGCQYPRLCRDEGRCREAQVASMSKAAAAD